MNRPTTAEICAELLNPLHEIFNLSECNGNFSAQLTVAIRETGKKVDDMTVRELRELIERETIKFNGEW